LKRALLIAFLTLTCFLQKTKAQVFTLKPAIGINAAQEHGDNYSGFHKAGIFGGAAVNSRLSSSISLELGFYFSQKGARHNPNPSKGDFNYYYLNLNYIDLPLSFRYHLNRDYFITAGPYMAYLTGYYENINYINYTGAYKFNSFEYGASIGLGKKIKEKWSFEVRTTNSIVPVRPFGSAILSNVFYPSAVARFFNKGFYNNVITFFVAYALDLKKKTSEPK
jgi:hypothetical protein